MLIFTSVGSLWHEQADYWSEVLRKFRLQNECVYILIYIKLMLFSFLGFYELRNSMIKSKRLQRKQKEINLTELLDCTPQLPKQPEA